MKLPNGYGSVTKLSGNRRKPYIARVTLGWITDEVTGKTTQNRVNIGTYRTKKEALQALAEYGSNPYDIKNDSMTLQELYAKWTEAYFPTLESSSSERTIASAWRYCHALYGMRVKDLRARHIKGIMENGYVIQERGRNAGQKTTASPGTKSRIKSMFNLMLDYALEFEIVDRNYARTFEVSGDIIKGAGENRRSHIPFSEDELQVLWDNVGSVKYVDWILIQCYMGWRPQEMGRLRLEDINLDELYITGGMKTDAGKNRTVPIHSRIAGLVKDNYAKAESLNSRFLLNDPESPRGGMSITYDKYAGRFCKVMDSLSFKQEHRPHDPRNTFVTRMKKAGADPLVVKRLIGHRINDITEEVYTLRDLDWLREDIEKMP